MANIEKRVAKDGKVSYRVKIRLKGYPIQSASFTRLTDARKWEQNTEVAIRSGKYFTAAEAKKHTFAELIERYKREILPLKPKSLSKQTSQLNWWKEKLGDYFLADITSSLINEYRQKLLTESIRTVKEKVNGKEVVRHITRTPSTANRYMAALSHAFSVAVKEWEWLEDTPIRKISKFKEPRGIVRFLSDEERKNMLYYCRESSNPLLYTIVVLTLSTGARRMEILGLRWQDIDFKRRVIILHETKNGERRTLPLIGKALTLMEAHNAITHQKEDYVFANKYGTAPIEIKRSWETALKKAGIEQFRFHDLRHSTASYLAMNGATLAEIAEVLGHKTLAMVKRYTHLSETHTTAVLEKMNEAIFL